MKEYYSILHTVREKTVDEDTGQVLEDRFICSCASIMSMASENTLIELANKIARALQAQYIAEMTTQKVQRSKSIDTAVSAIKEVLDSPHISVSGRIQDELIRKAKEHIQDVQRCLKKVDAGLA